MASIVPNKPNNSGSAARTGSRDRQVKNKKITPETNSSASKGKGSQSEGGGNAEKTAKRLTRGIIKDEVNDLRSQRREVNRSARHANAAVRAQYQHGRDDINAVHATTGGYIDAQNAKAQAGYDAASVEQSAAAAALQNQLQNVYSAGEGSATSEFARLGLTGETNTGFLNQLASDGANAQAQGAMTSSNNQANLGAMQANSGAVGQLLASMNQGSAMAGIGANLNARNAGFADNRAEQTKQLAAVREAIKDARGTRKDTFLQLLTQLRQTGWGGR